MSNSVNVLVATGTMNAGGAETLIMELLRQKSNSVNYYMLIHYDGEIKEGVYDKEIKELGIPIIYIHSVGSVGEKKYIEEFKTIVNDLGEIDVLHSHLNAVGGIICKAAKLAGIPKRIVHCHADITYKGNAISKFVNELKLKYMKTFINKFATDFWACSDAAAKRLFGNKKAVVIPNLINVNAYLSTPEKKAEVKEAFSMTDKKVLGSIGRIARIKNYELAIRIIDALNKKGQAYDFVCFGRVVDEAYFDELNVLIKELNIENQVHFLGNSTNVVSDINCFDIMLMPSYSEGFGMAAIESQAAGIPTLVSEGVPKLVDVEAGLIGFLPLDNVDAWVDAIIDTKTFCVDNDKILECFDKKGFNSVTMTKTIESYYID